MSSILTTGFVYFDGLKYSLIGTMGSSGPAGGDLSGFYPNPLVVGLQGRPISSVAPVTGQFLEWNGAAWEASFGDFAEIAGDLGGTPSSPLVIGMQGNPISSATPSTGQSLIWNGTAWAPMNSAGGFTAGGDLSGTSISQNVIKIHGATVPAAGSLVDGYVLQVTGSSTLAYGPVMSIQGNPILAQTLGAGQSNYALVWNGSDWSAENVFLNQSAGGDLGDFYPNPTTRALWHAAIPEVLPSNPGATTGFAIGNVLQVTNVTANTQALGYGPLNLANNVTGVLSTSNQAVQSASGDVSGSLAATTVRALLNIGLGSSSLGLAQDGYVLTYSHEFNEWLALSSTTGSSLAGDISGAITNTHVAELQGTTLSIGSPSTGQVLAWNGSAWTPQSLGLTLTGDVNGSTSISGTASTRVIAIQDNPIKNTILGSTQDGYVLTWNNTDGLWEAIINAGGEGAFVAGGDLSGVATDQTVIKINHTSVPASPGTNQVLIATSSTSATWGNITDSNVSTGAGIAGSKINTTTGGIVSVIASNTIQAAVLTATTEVSIGTFGSSPTITSGTGVPVSTPPNGSIFLRSDGTTDGTESIYSYEAGTWVPVGSAAAGAAGGDLSGFYPNPTVIALQKNPVDNTLLSGTQDGYVLTWVFASNEWKAKPFSASFTAGGDLSGNSLSQTVIAIHGNPVSGTAATAGQFLIENTGATGSAWTSLLGDVTASTSTVGKITVVALQGNAVEAQTLNSVDDGYVLTWHNASSQWQALPNATGAVTLSGDVTGASSSNTVSKINGTSVPATPTANQVLIASSGTAATWALLTNSQIATGAAISYSKLSLSNSIINSDINASAAIAYSKLNLTGDVVNADISGSAAIAVSKLAAGTSAQMLLNSGTPTPTWTSMSGDVTISNTGVTTVGSIQGVVITGTPASGYVLEATSPTAASWQAAASGSFSAGGDLSGTSTNQTVESIQGVVITGTPANGYVLEASSSTAASWQPGASGSFAAGGDLSGTSTVQNVIKLQGNAVQSGALGAGQDGYVLTWVNASSEWKAEPTSGSGGGETGKVIYTSKTVTSNYTVDSSENDYYIWCNQTAPINITLPMPSAGRTINIKDISNNANTNNITIVRFGSEEIEGVAASYVLSTNLDSVTLGSDGTNWWIV